MLSRNSGRVLALVCPCLPHQSAKEQLDFHLYLCTYSVHPLQDHRRTGKRHGGQVGLNPSSTRSTPHQPWIQRGRQNRQNTSRVKVLCAKSANRVGPTLAARLGLDRRRCSLRRNPASSRGDGGSACHIRTSNSSLDNDPIATKRADPVVWGETHEARDRERAERGKWMGVALVARPVCTRHSFPSLTLTLAFSVSLAHMPKPLPTSSLLFP